MTFRLISNRSCVNIRSYFIWQPWTYTQRERTQEYSEQWGHKRGGAASAVCFCYPRRSGQYGGTSAILDGANKHWEQKDLGFLFLHALPKWRMVQLCHTDAAILSLESKSHQTHQFLLLTGIGLCCEIHKIDTQSSCRWFRWRKIHSFPILILHKEQHKGLAIG